MTPHFDHLELLAVGNRVSNAGESSWTMVNCTFLKASSGEQRIDRDPPERALGSRHALGSWVRVPHGPPEKPQFRLDVLQFFAGTTASDSVQSANTATGPEVPSAGAFEGGQRIIDPDVGVPSCHTLGRHVQ